MREAQDARARRARAFDEAVDRLINDRRFEFAHGMKALRQMLAPDAEVVADRRDEGLRLIVREAPRRLTVELRAASAAVDALAVPKSRRQACNGRIEELERHQRAPGFLPMRPGVRGTRRPPLGRPAGRPHPPASPPSRPFGPAGFFSRPTGRWDAGARAGFRAYPYRLGVT